MVCQGCLSVDRKLTVVNDEVLKIYLSFLDTEYCDSFVQLCWECGALFKKLLRFRRQVRCAHTILVRYLIPQSKSLSTLQTTECKNIIEVDHDAAFQTTYVKVEDDLEDGQVGFSEDLMEFNVEDVELKTDIKCDPILEVPEPEKSKSRRRSKPCDVFDESDDEPLCKGDKTKPRGRRKNKDEGERGNKGRKRKASPGVVNNAKVQNKLQKLNADAEHLEMVVLSWDEIPQSKSLSTLQTTECKNIIEVDHDAAFQTTYVKVEDDLEDGQVGFSEDLMEFNVEDVELKTDIKCDPILEVSEPEKSKSRRRSKPCDVFDESDNEPLCKGDKTKPRGRRKNKDEGERGNKGRKRKASPGVVNNAKVQNKLQKLNADAEHLEMVVLSWDEVEAERQKAVKSHIFLRHEHRCYTCIIGFNHRCKLDDHNSKKHNPSYGTEECSVCRVRLKNSCSLKAHRRRHTSRWRCRVCGDVWSCAELAADHVARVHGGNTPVHTCGACGHTETSLGKLRKHIKTHSEKQKCEVCGKMCRNKDSLRTHLFIHKGEKDHACPRCGKRFLFKKAMELHLISHDASAQLYCHECDMNFKNKMSLNQHMRYSLKHVDPAKLKHACTLCDKKFVKAIRLEEHNLAVHLKMTPIKCTEQGCNFACSSRPVLRTHMRMLHRNGRAKRDHVCDVCGKAYSTKKILEGHLYSHSGERPYRCAACPAAFGYQAALYNHNKLVHLKLKSGGGRGAAPARAAAALPPASSLATASTHDTGSTLL